MNNHLVISEKLNARFRDVIAKNMRLQKGILKKCTENAIKEWILKNEERD